MMFPYLEKIPRALFLGLAAALFCISLYWVWLDRSYHMAVIIELREKEDERVQAIKDMARAQAIANRHWIRVLMRMNEKKPIYKEDVRFFSDTSALRQALLPNGDTLYGDTLFNGEGK